ncbi:MAG: biliverdin-producing heme oxygenase [Bacteroidota bacterium]
MNTATQPGFLDSLRTSTAQSHTALEALPISVSIMKPDVTNAEYTLYLDLMYDIVKDAEENIFPLISNLIPNLEARNKTKQLEADLAFLGKDKSGYDKALSSKIENLTPAFALGIMYTVEGSSLGGRVILKNINGVLGHDAENGARYFSGYGGQTGSMWKSFIGHMTQYETENDAAQEIIAGANFAFDAIAAHFNR